MTTRVSAVRIQPLDDFLATNIPASEWIVGGLVPGRGLIGVCGAPKVGKSIWGLGLAVSVAAGVDFLGRPVAQVPTLFVAEEGGPRSTQERLAAIRTRLAPGARRLPVHLALHQRIRLDTAEGAARLEDAIEASGARLVILDCLARMHQLAENDARDMARLTSELERIALQHGCAVVFIHHVAKVSEESGGGYAMRGSGVLASSTEANVVIRRSGNRTRLDAQLRDGPDVQLDLILDSTSFVFEGHQRVVRQRRTAPSTESVLEVLGAAGRSMTVDMLATALATSDTTLRPIINRLLEHGRVINDRTTGRTRWYRTA